MRIFTLKKIGFLDCILTSTQRWINVGQLSTCWTSNGLIYNLLGRVKPYLADHDYCRF